MEDSAAELLHARIGELLTENRDHETSFNLRWKADMRAIKRWQDATGRTLVWPDHADLCVWLMERIAELETQMDRHSTDRANMEIAELKAERDRALEKAAHLYKLSEMPFRSLDIALEDRDRLKHAERTMKAENARLRQTLGHLRDRFRACLIANGTAAEFADAAVEQYDEPVAPISGQNSPAGECAAKPFMFTPPPKYDQEYWDAMAKLDNSDYRPENSDNGQREGNRHHLTIVLIQMAEDYRLAANSAAYEDIAGEREKLEKRIYAALTDVFPLGSARQPDTSE